MERFTLTKGNKIEKIITVTVEIDDIRNEIMMLENEKTMMTERIARIDERIATLTDIIKNVENSKG